MRNFRIFSLLVFFFTAFTSNAQVRVIRDTLFYIQPYCGGARPTPEIEAESRKPKPYANRTMIIISDKQKVDSVKTDQYGAFKLKLKKGKYKMYEAWKYYKSTPTGDPLSSYDKVCLENEWKKDCMNIKISRSSISIDSCILIEHCPWNVPCISEQHLPPRRE